jgi:hypothetical protein
MIAALVEAVLYTGVALAILRMAHGGNPRDMEHLECVLYCLIAVTIMLHGMNTI